ncbi:serine/threonine protein kinase [Pseudonocardia sp. Ae168_Ps1]|uniref:serine protein kinase RIO n=1 Tax=unclassified Pseudonocardia TaxID=2619320 RepID=UPI00094B700C|nr:MULTISPECIES: RIO1 family regulatory kinase/ATPase [unclassified Pseudonocardia]OLL76694.1 serine/threonine protein kinase [Pseudonocardia sp. Ae150A_Ps1]OLL82705.1 serine/threonine protein kinase [Pseudonocardia sp. Ae168_Ps1]OLL83182.1 serine/threonine protein kinase [Pseudonocardia sp. Ae263_Ps1]OLL90780.1 serine/threonine protein kinase [Pseudonocardia sp. Ae356_Ps1]
MHSSHSSHSSRPSEPVRRRRRRFDDEDTPGRTAAVPSRLSDLDGRAGSDPDAPPEGDRWSTWPSVPAGSRGPRPWPSWMVTATGAVDRERGVLKTGKEADVHLVERGLPGRPGVLLAAKRYRDAAHRLFHRDEGYLEGRRVRRSRENRAMARRTSVGRDMIATRWAEAEFAALARLHDAGAPVPYPVSVAGTEVLMEFLGTPDGTAAPRLAASRPGPDERDALWSGLAGALGTLAGLGYAHGDLSAYNVLVHDGRPVLIDLPQVVDVVGNPRGPEFLERDVRRIGEWFVARGLDPDAPDSLLADLCSRLY